MMLRRAVVCAILVLYSYLAAGSSRTGA